MHLTAAVVNVERGHGARGLISQNLRSKQMPEAIVTPDEQIQILEGLGAAIDKVHAGHMAYLDAVKLHMTVLMAPRPDLDEIKGAIQELTKTASAIGLTPLQYVYGNAFYNLITVTELYFQRVIRAVVTVHPKKIGGVQFKLSEIVDATSISELVDKAIDEYLNKLMYKKPHEYLEDIASLLSIDKSVLQPFWPKFIEAKARRDLGIHNEWICNETYLRKVGEAGFTPQFKVGDLMVPGEWEYLRDTSSNLNDLAYALSTAVRALLK